MRFYTVMYPSGVFDLGPLTFDLESKKLMAARRFSCASLASSSFSMFIAEGHRPLNEFSPALPVSVSYNVQSARVLPVRFLYRLLGLRPPLAPPRNAESLFLWDSRLRFRFRP